MDFIQFDSSRVNYHLVIGFRLFVHCRLGVVWWMVNMWSFCFIIAFHNFDILKNQLTYQCPSSWPVVITTKKKLAGTWKINIGYEMVQNYWQQGCNQSNLEKIGRSCEGADFSWLRSKVSRTLLPLAYQKVNTWHFPSIYLVISSSCITKLKSIISSILMCCPKCDNVNKNSLYIIAHVENNSILATRGRDTLEPLNI